MTLSSGLLWGVVAMAQVDATVVAKKYVELLAAGKTADAARMHDATMANALPEPKLRETMGKVQAAGALSDCAPESTSQNGAFQVAVINCALGAARVAVKVTINADGQVSGLFFAPAAGRSEVAAAAPASYVDSRAFSDEKVLVRTGAFELPGTLCIPHGKGPFPAVVLVHGSGPHDEDETIGPNKPLRDLAQGLASKGVMTLRYTKRTLRYRAAISEDKEHYTVQHEVVEDAVSAAELLMERRDVSGVVVLGHSLGGYLVPRIGKAAPHLKGLVVMSGNVSALEDLVVAQVDYIEKTTSPSAEDRKELAQLRAAVAPVKTLRPDSPPVMGAPASYWLDLRDYHPAAEIARLPQALLFLQGGRDYQVPPSELEKWKSALKSHKDASYKTYPALNHLLMAGKGPSLPAEYMVASHVDAAVVADVAAFASRVAGP